MLLLLCCVCVWTLIDLTPAVTMDCTIALTRPPKVPLGAYKATNEEDMEQSSCHHDQAVTHVTHECRPGHKHRLLPDRVMNGISDRIGFHDDHYAMVYHQRLDGLFNRLLRRRSVVYHYGDVIMGTIGSQITSLTIVYSTVNSGADQRKHQNSLSLVFVRWIPRTNGQ